MEVLRKAFKQPFDPELVDFVASVVDDRELIVADLTGSMAHCAMLAEEGLITQGQASVITQGLSSLLAAAKAGKLELRPEWEDVHMNVEKQLEAIIGNDALRLHTARSRNDQVALDFRIYVSEQTKLLKNFVAGLQAALLKKAAEYSSVVMPGYTHLQPAQPVFFAHAMLAFYDMFDRDISRLDHSGSAAAVSPLGAGAQAGTALAINTRSTADKVGFPKVFTNSMDAVSDRDFAVEFLMACSLASTHLSQLAETLIIWNTKEFAYIEFSDSVTTSSSLMPQKKNPDPVELVRAKSGVSFGELINLLVVLKGLPLGYNRDLQETKSPVIRASRSLGASLAAMTVVINALKANAVNMMKTACDPELMATDLVEYLVLKGVPFREAHEAVTAAVQAARSLKCELSELPLAEFKQTCADFAADVFEIFDPIKSAASKLSAGGTGTIADILASKLVPH